MFGAWRRRRELARARGLGPTDDELAGIVARWPCLERLDADGRVRLAELAGRILATKAFYGAAGLSPDRGDCLPVAVLAALPVLNLDLAAYRQFHTFILYRDEFEVDLEETDEHGLVHRGRDLRAGEAWQRGPVVLSLADVRTSGQGDGYHVVVHELAHQLDQLNGEPDGFPPLPRGIRPAVWTEVFSAAFARLEAVLESGQSPWMDDYAAESPAEFFAVSSEYFFDAPRRLRRHEPELYRLLAAFYRQDPAATPSPAEATLKGDCD